MKPTAREIGKKQIEYCVNSKHNFISKAFVDGAQWAISKIQPEWISVEDRLPEVTDYANRVYHAVMSDQGHYNYKALAWFGDPVDGDKPDFQICDDLSSIGKFKHTKVTHWLEFPQEPQPPTK